MRRFGGNHIAPDEAVRGQAATSSGEQVILRRFPAWMLAPIQDQYGFD
jgi:hypothetical protein